MAVIAEEDDDKRLSYMLKDVKKREWLLDILDSDDLTLLITKIY